MEKITNCFKCGSKLPPNSIYCFKCGFKLKDSEETDSIYSYTNSEDKSHYFEMASQRYYLSGITYYKKGDSKKAIDEFSKAIELKKDFADAHYHRGQAYVQEAMYEDAINDFTRAIEIDPEFKDAYFQRGNIFFEKGFKDRARDDYEKIIELDLDIASHVYEKLHDFMESWVHNIVSNVKSTPADEKDYINDS